MKSVLISIQPKWCKHIANRYKTFEVRKTKPKLETPFKCYIYCSKTKNQFLQSRSNMFFYCENRDTIGGHGAGLYRRLNGKVIGEFVCDKIKKIKADNFYAIFTNNPQKKTCMGDFEMLDYANGKNLFLWHISDLVIYDTPKKLNEFTKAGALSYDDWLYGIYNGTSESTYEKYLMPFKVTRPPQSWCYVERLGDL